MEEEEGVETPSTAPFNSGLSVLQSFLHVLLLASATPGQSG